MSRERNRGEIGGQLATQMRVYVINRGQMDAFVAAWLAGVYPLRQRHGFAIPNVWINRERSTFIWLLRYDGEQSWEDAEADYYASPERTTMSPDPRQHIAQTNEWFIDPLALPD